MSEAPVAGDTGGRDPDGVAVRAPGDRLRAAVLSVGSELLLGDLTDSNATWLSKRLTELGVDVVGHMAAGDVLDRLVDAIEWLRGRVHVVVVGGGLGPTQDDLTREAVAAAAGVELSDRDDLARELEERFAEMGRRMAPQNLRQVRIPAGARAFPAVGTAPAFALTLPGDHPLRLFALPGVPWEMHALWDRDVAPEIQALAGPGATLTRVVHVAGRGESDVAEQVEPLLAGRDDVLLSFLARSQEIQVRLTVSADDPDAARAASQPLVDEVVAALGPAVAGIDDQQLEDVVLRLLGDTGTTLATAESATAGDIASRLGRVPGASHGLVGGAVVYATDAKRDVLGLPQALLDDHGPVSEPVTEALAAAARGTFASDWGLAVTGVAGPDSQGDLPVGTCCWALAHPDGQVEVHGRRIPGDRGQIIARLGTVALDLLRRRLTELDPPTTRSDTGRAKSSRQ